jgi:hypothetical protein
MKKTIKIWFIIFYAILLVACGNSGTGTGAGTGAALITPTQISWTEPQQNNDNSELTNLLKYRFYYGAAEDSLTPIPELDLPASLLNPSAGAVVTHILTPSDIAILTPLVGSNTTHYYAVTAINTQNIESSLSSPIAQYIP